MPVAVNRTRARALVISESQSTIDAVTQCLGYAPHVILPSAIITSTSEAKQAMLAVQSEDGPNLVVIDVPGLRVPQGNSQDRRMQSQLVSWARWAARAGKSVLMRGYRGPQWKLGPITELVGLPSWNLSKHVQCRHKSPNNLALKLSRFCL